VYLITGAGGGIGSVSRSVVEELRSRGAQVQAMVHRDDERADPLREVGAEVVVGDLSGPESLDIDGLAAEYGRALHRAGRYDRATDDVERITGRPALSVEQYVAANPQLFA
jgi:NAD(P)-dependent dehydrogenase (short-subunit alcohol dehydrogenase family)